MSAAFSAIAIIVLITFAVTTWGMIDASTTRTPSTPLNLIEQRIIVKKSSGVILSNSWVIDNSNKKQHEKNDFN